MEKLLSLGVLLVGAIVAAICAIDLVIGFPFGGIDSDKAILFQDVILLVTAALISWQGFELLRKHS